jgi:hypothetical protein
MTSHIEDLQMQLQNAKELYDREKQEKEQTIIAYKRFIKKIEQDKSRH